MDKPESETELFKKSREFLEVFKKGEEFTQDLLKENELLRFKIVDLKGEISALIKGGESSNLSELQHAFSKLQQEKEEILSRVREVEAENKDFAQKYIEVEEENNNLANLYVASYQLHSTLDLKEVLKILQEIIINLVGAERFTIMVAEGDTEELVPVVSEGLDEGFLRKIKFENPIITDVLRTGENYFGSEIGSFSSAHEFDPLICIPLKINDKSMGVLAIFSFLQQKNNLTGVDFELFSMLAGHAATAIFSSRLYSVSERKLSTIQGFINLLSGKGKEEV